MKKLISVLLSFSLIFNVIGHDQMCEVNALEVTKQNGGQADVSNNTPENEMVAKKFWPLLSNLLAVTAKNVFGFGLEAAELLLAASARVFLASYELFTGALSSEISLCRNDENCAKELKRVIEENKKLEMCLKDKNCVCERT